MTQQVPGALDITYLPPWAILPDHPQTVGKHQPEESLLEDIMRRRPSAVGVCMYVGVHGDPECDIR